MYIYSQMHETDSKQTIFYHEHGMVQVQHQGHTMTILELVQQGVFFF